MFEKYNQKVQAHTELVDKYNGLVKTRNIIQSQLIETHDAYNNLIDKINYGVMHPSDRDLIKNKASRLETLLKYRKDELNSYDRRLDDLQIEVENIKSEIDNLKDKIESKKISKPKKKKWGWF